MLRRIDHIVVVVRELAQAVAGYEQAGFTVVPGGEHVGGATHNALVSFADGTYFELIAFKEPDRPQEHRWWERLRRGEGLVDYALGSDDLNVDAEQIAKRGLAVRGPADGGRQRPDGKELIWRSFFLGSGAGRTGLPFVIQDVTPRELRVPGGDATRHRLPVTRVAGLTLAVSDLAAASRELGAALGTLGEATDARGERAARRFALGEQWLELLQPASAASAAGSRIQALGEGPYEVVLAGDRVAEPGSGKLIDGDLNGARIRVASVASPRD